MLLLPIFTMALAIAKPEATMFVGTYTDPQGSKGIYRVRLNTETGALSEAELAAETPAPSYIAFRPDGKVLYSVNEYSDGEVSAFAIKSDQLTKLNTVKLESKGSCHISVDPFGKWLLVSAYGGGTLAVLPILADGSIGAPSDLIQNSGNGPNKSRQQGPHMHFATQVEKFVYACDLGTDEILSFTLNDQTGKLTATSQRSAKPAPGSGPRHLVIHPDGETIFVNDELTLNVSVFDRNEANGHLRLVQTISTLPDGASAERKSTAAIHMHPRVPVLYVSNRGDNSIAIFHIRPDRLLELKKVLKVDAVEPRDFAIDPTGNWMIVAGQNNGELISMPIDSSGMPGAISGRCKVPKPVCIGFLPWH